MTDIVDSACGVRTKIHWDDQGATFEYIQDVEPILDTFQELSSMGHNRSAHGRLAATIPISTYYSWKREWEDRYKSAGVITFDAFVISRLNSPDYKKLRNQNL